MVARVTRSSRASGVTAAEGGGVDPPISDDDAPGALQ